MVSELLKRFSNFAARVPGLPIIIAIGLVALNFVLQFLPDWPVLGWLARTDFLLHIGLVLGFLGVLLGEAL
jgi:hypothetical protein